MKAKIFVGLSGGVDSSVAAALLKEQGHDVTGVFIKIWDEKWGVCQWKQDRKEAMKVALHLGIPFKTLDLSMEYKRDVLNYMLREYRAGRTPNPDVMCNTRIKFGDFLKWSLKNGADYVATGHYIRKSDVGCQMSEFRSQKSDFGFRMSDIKLLRGIDENKDQSYFLWQLEQNQLKHCLFPIGDYTKPEVRKLARKLGLPTAEKKDSQGICFVGKVGMKDFLKNYIKPKRGKVLNTKGEIIGEHDGAMFLTIGQRHGFTITKKGTDDRPYYVVSKNIKSNTITIAHCLPKNERQFKQKNVIINKVSWINEIPSLKKNYKARIRYRQPLQTCCIIKCIGRRCVILFDKPQQAITSGQSLVIYNREECLGGGIMK